MATINNPETLKKIVMDAGIQTAYDSIPTRLANSVVPVIVANPKPIVNIVKWIASVGTGTQTLYTTPTDKDFFLTNVIISAQADVNCDNTVYDVTATPDEGGAIILLRLPKITLTVFQDSISVVFPHPIKIARGTTITFGTTYTAGVSHAVAQIMGYTKEKEAN